MGFIRKGDAADQNLRATRRELRAQHNDEAPALRRGEPGATARNDDLQDGVRAAKPAASRGERFRG